MIGRAEIVSALMVQLTHRRFITIAGPGGIGKTRVASAVADALAADYRDGVVFVDLAPLNSSHLVAGALASLLGLPGLSDSPLSALTNFLNDKQLLLVLDGCEHVVDAAAAIAEGILRAAPEVHMLATSREPLRAENERVQRLPPLGFPTEWAGLKAAQAMSFPAIQLLAERAGESLDGFELSDADAPYAAKICRQLDGIALAIELAARRIEAFGVRGLADLLDDRLWLLAGGRRTATSRHQTLIATLDWSYSLLTESEQIVLRRLAVFSASFTLDLARRVVVDDEVTESSFVDGVANLVAKSLVSADTNDVVVRYRTLDTTRAYARQRLVENGELDHLARRHAECCRDLLDRAGEELNVRPSTESASPFGPHIDDVRAALDWAFSTSGDRDIAASLVVAAVPLWFQLSLISECRQRVEEALRNLEGSATVDLKTEMQLFSALGEALMNWAGAGPRMQAAWTRARELAQRLNDTDYLLRALWGLWVDQFNDGNHPAALMLAEEFGELAARTMNPTDISIGDRMKATSLHYLGDQVGAKEHIELSLACDVGAAQRSHIIRFQFDHRIAACCIQAFTLLLRGFPTQALDRAKSNVSDALATNHVISVNYALSEGACPIALLVGDLVAAENFIDLLLDQSRDHGLDVWHAIGLGFKGVLQIKQDGLASGIADLHAGLQILQKARFAPHCIAFMAELAEATGRSGRIMEGINLIDSALTRSERNQEHWCTAELLRIKGELLIRQGGAEGGPAAEELFLQSLDVARQQDALFWQLRTAMSLARHWQGQSRGGEPRDNLVSVFRRFGEGYGTSDLLAAKQLLVDLTIQSSA